MASLRYIDLRRNSQWHQCIVEHPKQTNKVVLTIITNPQSANVNVPILQGYIGTIEAVANRQLKQIACHGDLCNQWSNLPASDTLRYIGLSVKYVPVKAGCDYNLKWFNMTYLDAMFGTILCGEWKNAHGKTQGGSTTFAVQFVFMAGHAPRKERSEGT